MQIISFSTSARRHHAYHAFLKSVEPNGEFNDVQGINIFLIYCFKMIIMHFARLMCRTEIDEE